MWQTQDGLIDTLFVLAWGLRTFRVAGILTSPLCWMVWLTVAPSPGVPFGTLKSMVLIVKTCIIYESSLFILSQVYIHREYDFLDYESGEVSSTKSSSEPLYAPKMIYDFKNQRRKFKGQVRWDEKPWKEMKRQFNRQLKWDVQPPKYVKHVNRWKGSRFFSLIRLKQV